MAAVENWLPVVGYEGFYEVSNLGNVRSVDREFVNARGHKRLWPGKAIKPMVGTNGYPSVGLKKIGTVKRCNVHSLVMAAFVGGRPHGMDILHKDGCKTNPKLDNLRYGTKSENGLDAVRHGHHPKTKRTHCPRGHELKFPNLTNSHYRRGSRDCRACGQARTWLKSHPESGMTLQLVGDDRYQKIMSKGGK